MFFCLTTSCGLVWCWCSVRLFMSNRRTPWQRCEPQASSQWSWGLLVRVRPVSWGQRLLFSSLDSGINHFSFFREGVNSIPAIKSQLWWLNSQTANILTSFNIKQDKVYIYVYIYIHIYILYIHIYIYIYIGTRAWNSIKIGIITITWWLLVGKKIHLVYMKLWCILESPEYFLNLV